LGRGAKAADLYDGRGGLKLWLHAFGGRISGKDEWALVGFEPKGIGDAIGTFEDEVAHHFGNFRGNAEADFEAAVGDEMAGSVGPGAEKRRAG